MEEWTVHYFDKRLNSEEVSRIFASQEDALRHACDLELKNCITHHIRGPNKQHILPEAISVWCREHTWHRGLVGIEGDVVSGVINLEPSGVEVPDWRPRHDEHYHEA
jgi:hypothetical protein